MLIMTPENRPLWEILSSAADNVLKIPLNCDECFQILVYLADAAQEGVQEQVLRDAVKQHLDICPDCRKHHLGRLKQLEEGAVFLRNIRSQG
jgi:hypothetical protein